MKMEKRDIIFESILFLAALAAYAEWFFGNAADPDAFRSWGILLMTVLALHQVLFIPFRFRKKQ